MNILDSYNQGFLLSKEQIKETIDCLEKPVGEPITSQVVLGKGKYNHYRINVFSPGQPTPFPDNLDFYIEREVKLLKNGRKHYLWEYLNEKKFATVALKVFWVASRLMTEHAGITTCSGVINLDGVPIQEECIFLCQQIRAFGNVRDWQEALTATLNSYWDFHNSLAFGSNKQFTQQRSKYALQVLELCGLSPVELQFAITSFSPTRGLDLKRNRFLRTLQATHQSRFIVLELIQTALDWRKDLRFSPERATAAIIGQLSTTFLPQIVRLDGTLRWDKLDLKNPNPEDVAWELEHGRYLPPELVSSFPGLVMRFGL